MAHRLLVSLVVLFSSIGFAADAAFHKQAIIAISHHLKKDLPNLADDISEDANNYLQTAVTLFSQIKSSAGSDSLPSGFRDLLVGMPAGSTITFGGSSITMAVGGHTSTTTINGKTQKTID